MKTIFYIKVVKTWSSIPYFFYTDLKKYSLDWQRVKSLQWPAGPAVSCKKSCLLLSVLIDRGFDTPPWLPKQTWNPEEEDPSLQRAPHNSQASSSPGNVWGTDQGIPTQDSYTRTSTRKLISMNNSSMSRKSKMFSTLVWKLVM